MTKPKRRTAAAPKSDKQQESAVLVMTDLHYGKKTSTFSVDVFKEKLDAIGERVNSIYYHLTGYEFDELVVCMLGDVVDGSEIYPTQAHHQDESNVEEQAEQLAEILGPFLLELKQTWLNVRVECVPGNHGRAGRFAHEGASWDMVAYRYLKAKVKPEIAVNWTKSGDKFLRKIDVRGHPMLLYHGHDIKMFQSIPWYGLMNRVARWNTTSLAPFEVVMTGHFHSFGMWPLNKVTLLQSGTMVTDDEWALRTLGYESANKWWMFGVSNKRPITWSFGLDL